MTRQLDTAAQASIDAVVAFHEWQDLAHQQGIEGTLDNYREHLEWVGMTRRLESIRLIARGALGDWADHEKGTLAPVLGEIAGLATLEANS